MIDQPYRLEARQLQALSLAVQIPLVCFAIAFPVMMIWVRNFKGGPRGTFFGTVFRLAGKPLFGRDARHMLQNLEKLEEGV